MVVGHEVDVFVSTYVCMPSSMVALRASHISPTVGVLNAYSNLSANVLFESMCICSVVKEDRYAGFLPTKGIVFTSVNIALWYDMPGRISILFTRFGLFVVMISRMFFHEEQFS